jgi:hypothetical protein
LVRQLETALRSTCLLDNPDDDIPAAPLMVVGDVRSWRESCPLAARIRYYSH